MGFGFFLWRYNNFSTLSIARRESLYSQYRNCLFPTQDAAELEPEWQWAADISLVYTWVNGSEPLHQQSLLANGGEIGGPRDRDNGDFFYSVRAE